MQSLFIGHGSPMNIVEKNVFTESLVLLGERLSRPRLILAISAHWETDGLWLQNSPIHKIYYDFYGFPEQLYKVQYPVAGWHQNDLRLLEKLNLGPVRMDSTRGIDHGVWSILYHMYPNADIPVLQMSLNKNFSFLEHYHLGEKLKKLRENNILILGSGNIVHNLRQIDWDAESPAKPWALDMDQKVKDLILKKEHQSILQLPKSESHLFSLSHPTHEHFIPLLYNLGASQSEDSIEFPCELIQNSSISMRSVLFKSSI